MKHIHVRYLLLLVIGILTVHQPIHSQWSTNPNVTTPVCTADQEQDLYGIMSDGVGGVIITWMDSRDYNGDIYAQRLDSAGFIMWTSNGVLISTATYGQYDPLLATDGARGAIITWVRSGTSEDIYAQHINEYGVAQWTSNGVPISTAAGNQQNPVIISDGTGGAIIAWMDYRNGSDYDIYAQRINSAGLIQWTSNAAAISAVSGNQMNPVIVSDGAGGAIISWECDSAASLGYNIYAQRVNSSGVKMWTVNGVPISLASNDQRQPCIVSDGADGAIITWRDYRSGSNWDVYAQRVDDTGGVVWSMNGIPIATASGHQYFTDIASDNSGGAIITWTDYRNGVDYDIYAQRVNHTGTIQWPTNGVGISTLGGHQESPKISGDNQGGAVICWVDGRADAGDPDIYAQRVTTSGGVYWTPNGTAISTDSDDQTVVRIASDGGYGAIIAIEQSPGEGYSDIYAQRIMGNGVFPMSSISGVKFQDINSNSERDEGEPGIASWKIYLGGAMNDSAITDMGGTYIFDSLVAGSYTIREEIRNSWECTYPPSDTFSLYLALNENVSEYDFGNFTPASLSGVVWNDLNANGIREPADTLLPNWLVSVRGAFGGLMDTVVTDSKGNYAIPYLDNGLYIINLVIQDEWIQSYPPGLGEYMIEMVDGAHITDKNFGAVYGYKYVGPSSGNWSDSANWTGNRPPGSTDNIIIPSDAAVTVDSLPSDSIRSIRIKAGGSLSFVPNVGRLKVTGKVRIDDGGVLNFPTAPGSTGMICYNDWIKLGAVNPGYSTITFTGEVPKVIASQPGTSNTFHHLEIEGVTVSAEGNITIKNKLFLHADLSQRGFDTLFIDINDTSAIQNDGKILNGTIKRRIAGGITGKYRFESPSTYVKFTGSGVNPITLSMTVVPPVASDNFFWEFMGGNVDTVNNVITIDTVKKFSKWPFGIPPATMTATSEGMDLRKTEFIERFYLIDAESGESYNAEVSLRYNQSDVPHLIDESELALWRGPFLIDSVQSGWNLKAMSLIAEDCHKEIVFPDAISPAFAYEGTYVEREILQFCEGYWLKYPDNIGITVEGEDKTFGIIPVQEGWNLIGAISYPVAGGSVVSFPPGIITSMFFGYRNGYVIEDTLKPLFAYWIKVSRAGELMLAFDGGGSETHYEKPSLEKFNKLSFKDAVGNEGILYFGGDAKININRFELPPTPPTGIFDIRYETGRILEVSQEKGNNESHIVINSAVYPVTLSWDIVEANQEAPAMLVVGKEEYSLLSSNKTIIADSTIQILLIIHPEGSNNLPKEFALEQNYPNPFNPSTTIQYQLPVDSKVTIKVYNVLGQVIQTLADEVQSTGYKAVEWNAAEYASGVYFYRLEAVGVNDINRQFNQVRKLIVIK